MFRGCIIILFVCCFLFLDAQVPAPENAYDPGTKFRHITVKHGLSNNNVIKIFQDRYGFMWLGTVNGLNKYDGQNIEVFLHDPHDPESISSNLITAIAEDSRGNLWVATDNGINKYHRTDNNFTRYFNSSDSLHDLPSPYIRAMHFDTAEVLWLDDVEGNFIRYDLATGTHNFKKHRKVTQPYYYYHTIYDDGEGDLWIGGRSIGILQYRKASDSLMFLRYGPGMPGKKRESDVACYFKDSRGNFWVTGFDGAYLFDKPSGRFEKFLQTSTWSVAEDQEGNIWFGTGSGLIRYEPFNNKIYHFDYQPENIYSLASNNVHRVFVDRANNIWVCTDQGINILDRPEYKFRHITHIPGTENSLSSDKVRAVVQANDGRIWIGTDGEGLNLYDPVKNTFEVFRTDTAKNSIASNRVSALYEDRRGDLWIGLWSGIGFDKYSPDEKAFIHYRHEKKNTFEDWYNDFAEDHAGNFYLGFWGGPGLITFNREKAEFGRPLWQDFENGEQSRLIECLLTDDDGNIWIGTTNAGLYKYDPVSGKSKQFYYPRQSALSGHQVKINSLFGDSGGNIWIGWEGLSKFNAKGEELRTYTIADGLVNNTVKGILEDDQGNLWISTENGLSKFDPLRETFRNYYDFDGIHDNWFSKAACKLKDGRMIFGGNSGFILFHPDSIRDSDKMPPLRITDFRISGRDSIKDLSLVDTIELDYDQNFFSFQFGAIDFRSAGKLDHSYKLEGFNNLWQESRKTNRGAVFTNVPAGKYIFYTRLKQRFGGEEQLKSIVINIRPPFWETWWFYLIVAIVFVMLIYLLFRMRIKKIRRERNTALLRHKLLRTQMNPHFIFNSLTAVQNHIYGKKPEEAGKYLSDFSRLMRLILYNSREEYIPLEREIETLDLYLKLQSFRFDNKFSYSLEVDPELDREISLIPPMLAQPFIENALEHGLKYRQEGGYLKAAFILKDDMLLLEIEDNGIGINSSVSKSGEKSHKSLAMEISGERINILSNKSGKEINLQIVDLADENEGHTGTRVRFWIPFRTK